MSGVLIEIDNSTEHTELNDAGCQYIHEYSTNEKKIIINKIKMLSKIEHVEIFKMLKNNNIKYTENSNGIFINFININNKVIVLLDNFINFCLENKDTLVENEKIIKEKQNIVDTKYSSSSSSCSDDEDTPSEELFVTNIDGSKINLKKIKPIYTGIQAKIIKNYKDGVKLNK